MIVLSWRLTSSMHVISPISTCSPMACPKSVLRIRLILSLKTSFVSLGSFICSCSPHVRLYSNSSVLLGLVH